MIGMPAFTKTPSWREKCMRSLRFTDFLVISNWRTFFLSISSTELYPRSSERDVGSASASAPALSP